MPSWGEILKEAGETPSQFDYIRRNYICKLSELTGRDTIAYYSAFLDKPKAPNLDINDSDMVGFMNAVHGLRCDRGLDLILHTPGGDPTAAEAIVGYLKDKFDKDIRVIVPQIAMSAGTMIACCGKTIIMGKQSSLGPIDPQFNTIPAYNIKDEFEEAKNDLAIHPENAQYWAIKINQYPAAFMKSAMDAIDLSGELAKKWLSDVMLRGEPQLIDKVVNALNNHGASKVHARHYSYKDCQEIGLKIEMMEEDDALQDAILSVHHSFIITFSKTPATKIIGNSDKHDYVWLSGVQ